MLKILVLVGGTLILGTVCGVALLGIFNLLAGLPVNHINNGGQTAVGGVLKYDDEDLGVARIRHRLTGISVVLGFCIPAIGLFYLLFM